MTKAEALARDRRRLRCKKCLRVASPPVPDLGCFGQHCPEHPKSDLVFLNVEELAELEKATLEMPQQKRLWEDR